jgi:hypothetical protein
MDLLFCFLFFAHAHAAAVACRCLAGNPDALWLLGGLLPVQPARVAKTLQAHREAAHRQVTLACSFLLRSACGL